ncbi:MAG: tail protein X [Firmicutes bacterium]|nr:tail protein X [Bacillota bacterium]
MGGYYYTTKQGDMWDYIAWKVYNNEKLIGELLNAEENREIMSTYIFSAGVKVWCPEVTEQTAESSMAPWRESS